jgi:hypothetical protein
MPNRVTSRPLRDEAVELGDERRQEGPLAARPPGAEGPQRPGVAAGLEVTVDDPGRVSGHPGQAVGSLVEQRAVLEEEELGVPPGDGSGLALLKDRHDAGVLQGVVLVRDGGGERPGGVQRGQNPFSGLVGFGVADRVGDQAPCGEGERILGGGGGELQRCELSQQRLVTEGGEVPVLLGMGVRGHGVHGALPVAVALADVPRRAGQFGGAAWRRGRPR